MKVTYIAQICDKVTKSSHVIAEGGSAKRFKASTSVTKYDEEAMKEAVKHIREGTMSLSKAAKTYQLPR